MPDDKLPSKQKQIEEFIFLKIPHVLSGVLFLVAVVINIINVIARYVFSSPIFWAEETLIFLVIWIVFLVAGAITYRGAHLNMDLLYSNMTARWKLMVNVVITLTLIFCTTFTAFQSWKVVDLHYHTHWRHRGDQNPVGHSARCPLVWIQFHGTRGDCAGSDRMSPESLTERGGIPCIGLWDYYLSRCCCWAFRFSFCYSQPR